ncbi:hypothetical protein ACIQVA_19505 [Streptomyces microflavus]|uniref:hypothetical protein n=1 Tax=Streptomyces microflavus TaxID=1919 RepID=UPI0037F2493C
MALRIRGKSSGGTRAMALASAIAAVTMALAACGTTGGGAEENRASGGEKEKNLQYAQCLRDNGVDVPDPKPGEEVGMSFPEGTSPQKVEEATKACKQYAPPGHTKGELEGFKKEALEMAKCFREHGVEVDDPTADGVFIPPQGEAQNTPTFQKAMEACTDASKRQNAGGQ